MGQQIQGWYDISEQSIFKNHPTALQIILYLDGIQFCNSIGSYSHDVVYVHFTLG
jgi:hypothetical protein